MVTGFGLGITASGHKFAAAAAARSAVELTPTNAVTSTSQKKFGVASAEFTSTGGWDYIDATGPTGLLNLGTGDFTVEMFVRFDNTNTDVALYSGATTNGDMDIRRTSDNLVRLGRVNTAWDLTSSATGITANTWHHIAVVRSSGTAYIFVDGVSKGSASNSIDYSMATQLRIGAHSTASLGLGGYIDELRVSDSARYTSGFTPTTSEFVNDSNTLLLLHMNGPNVTVVNQAQKDTAENQWGNASLLLDGTNDRLELSGDYSQSGDFTVECWFYATSTSGTRCIFAIGNEGTDRQFVNVQGSNLYTDEYGAGGVDINGTGNGVSASTWHHCALSRSGTNVSLYLDGTRVGSTTSSATIGNSNNIYIGTLSDGAVDFVGNIDEFRVSTNARYTGASYTVPTSGFTNDSNTQVLLHMDGDDTGTGFTFEDDTISS